MMQYIRLFSRVFAPVLLIFSACACSTEGNIQRILGTSAEAPVFLDCRSVSPTELVFRFSQSVKVVSLNFDSGVMPESVEDGREVKVYFARPFEEGKRITADILVEDADRNSLNVIVPFRTRNDRMPALLFNELKPEAASPKSEFVEFFASGPGNLAGLRLFIAGYSLDTPAYEFPQAEVKAGEYIVLHLRTREESGCVDETGDNLALSGGTEAHNNGRDFWLPGNKKLLHETEVLWLMGEDDRIIDAVMLSEKPDAVWAGKNNTAAAEFLGRNGAWLFPAGEGAGIPGPAAAVISGASTNTRSVCRDESVKPPEPRAGNWYISATSGASPGEANNPKRYQ